MACMQTNHSRRRDSKSAVVLKKVSDSDECDRIKMKSRRSETSKMASGALLKMQPTTKNRPKTNAKLMKRIDSSFDKELTYIPDEYLQAERKEHTPIYEHNSPILTATIEAYHNLEVNNYKKSSRIAKSKPVAKNVLKTLLSPYETAFPEANTASDHHQQQQQQQQRRRKNASSTYVPYSSNLPAKFKPPSQRIINLSKPKFPVSQTDLCSETQSQLLSRRFSRSGKASAEFCSARSNNSVASENKREKKTSIIASENMILKMTTYEKVHPKRSSSVPQQSHENVLKNAESEGPDKLKQIFVAARPTSAKLYASIGKGSELSLATTYSNKQQDSDTSSSRHWFNIDSMSPRPKNAEDTTDTEEEVNAFRFKHTDSITILSKKQIENYQTEKFAQPTCIRLCKLKKKQPNGSNVKTHNSAESNRMLKSCLRKESAFEKPCIGTQTADVISYSSSNKLNRGNFNKRTIKRK